MNNRYRIILLFLLALSLTGCGGKPRKAPKPDGKLRIAAAIFPAYDWVKNILGENPADAELTLLADNGVDMHSYQPSVDDILTITNADLFIYVGGESDKWVSDALKQANNPDICIIKMLDVIGSAAKEEEIKEGMQAEAEPEEESELDEHVWLSLRNAESVCGAIRDGLSAMDPANAKVYEDNAAAYITKLHTLDSAYQQAISGAPLKTLLFGDRFPFRYLIEDYGLDYYAAFSGCSAETEAGFETITFLAQKADELALPAVLTIDGSDGRIAGTIVQNTSAKNQQILMLDSMQSVSSKDIEAGKIISRSWNTTSVSWKKLSARRWNNGAAHGSKPFFRL